MFHNQIRITYNLEMLSARVLLCGLVGSARLYSYLFTMISRDALSLYAVPA